MRTCKAYDCLVKDSKLCCIECDSKCQYPCDHIDGTKCKIDKMGGVTVTPENYEATFECDGGCLSAKITTDQYKRIVDIMTESMVEYRPSNSPMRTTPGGFATGGILNYSATIPNGPTTRPTAEMRDPFNVTAEFNISKELAEFFENLKNPPEITLQIAPLTPEQKEALIGKHLGHCPFCGTDLYEYFMCVHCGDVSGYSKHCYELKPAYWYEALQRTTFGRVRVAPKKWSDA